jgi:hypothetical protein
MRSLRCEAAYGVKRMSLLKSDAVACVNVKQELLAIACVNAKQELLAIVTCVNHTLYVK